jgi:hypothetical protein
MNPIKRWLTERSRVLLKAERALGKRLSILITGLRSRLSQDRLNSIDEYAGQAEWELAIETIWVESRDLV